MMNVSLTPQLEEFVPVKVGTGRYSSVSEGCARRSACWRSMMQRTERRLLGSTGDWGIGWLRWIGANEWIRQLCGLK